MKAAVYRENGGPEVLSYEEVADPVPGADEVLIRVEAISIEGADLLNRQRVPLPHSPHIVGYSTAGTVIAVGEHITGLRVGQRVSAFGETGSHAELRVVRPDHCWVLPDGIDAAAACVPVAFGTAYEALFERAAVTTGSTVLVQGVAGGVGFAAVQLAAKAGARVIGTGSSQRQLDALRRLGLHDGIDYTTEDVRRRVLELTDGVGVDLVVDPVGGPMTQELILATREGGTITFVGASAGQPLIDPVTLAMGDRTMKGFMLSKIFHTPRVRAYLADIFRRVAEGDLDVLIDRTFPLADATDAHRYAEQRGRLGRVVMTP
ncbi:quinone oxidoreductase family protein [Streptomyces sp. ME18-1-4]|uniref:quinone oxidoreductase family protein n=1 Tax=Streptomyces sp. ME18-1-4 TaxID=3028685 RepID=UPI0029BC8515|nr:zinc-binding dehydrogenase [Streptomyces sp. ME18-1-4]MDX3247911.1 zinc-binding dehydrogenase [Streptomyces sp. ME18-1-4]